MSHVKNKTRKKASAEKPVLSLRKSLSQLLCTGLVLCLFSCVVGVLGLYFCTGTYGFPLLKFYLSSPKLLALNLLPFVLISLFFWFISNRAWFGFAFSSLICLIFSFAQGWMLLARSDAIYAKDLALYKEAAQMSQRYASFTRAHILTIVITVVLAVLLFRFFCGRFSHIAPRLLLPLIMLYLFLTVLTGLYTNTSLYNSLPCWSELNSWIEVNQYISRGGFYPFLYSFQSMRTPAPEGYDEQEAVALLEQYDTDDIPEEKKVSVISVMLEAYVDLSKISDCITGVDPYSCYHQLQEESYTGRLVTNIFSGGTVNTERSFLTGACELQSFRTPAWSYARYFSDQGYAINAAHAGYKDFYNRLNINRNLGLGESRFQDNYYNTELGSEWIPADAEFLADVADYCKKQIEQEQSPVFSFNVTYQNHGPYATDTKSFDREYVPHEGLSDYDYSVVNSYLTGIEDTGYQLQALADAFRDYEEPVVLVIYGDHKPWLGDQNSTYAALGIDLDLDTETGFYNYYSTEYLFWANDAAKEALGTDLVGEGPDISACFMMNELFSQLDWDGPSFLKLSNPLRDVAPIVTSNDWYLDGSKLVHEDELRKSTKEKLQQLRYAQYYLARASGGVLPAKNAPVDP